MLKTFAHSCFEISTAPNMESIAVGLPEQLSTDTSLGPWGIGVAHLFTSTLGNCEKGVGPLKDNVELLVRLVSSGTMAEHPNLNHL